MPLPIYTSAAFTNGSGVSVASNASVEVRRESDGSLVPIFEDRDGQNQITQPGFQADLEGRFEFYAEPAAEGWEITVTAGPDTHTLNSQFPQGGVFGIPEGERAINSEELLAAVSEAADVGEAVSFVGRGAIVESGTNANGSYVRWENGEQVCFGDPTLTFNSSSTMRVTWSFPAAFVNSDHYTTANLADNFQNTVANAGGMSGGLRVRYDGSQQSGSVIIDQSRAADTTSFESGDTILTRAMAWGFWK